MPEPTLEQQPGSQDQGWNPPGGEVDLDQIFGGAYEPDVHGDDQTGQPQPQQTQQVVETKPATTEPAPKPQAIEPQFFLETDTGTRYRSKEDAVRGYAEKDRSIEEMRQLFIALHGVDPLTKKQASPQGPASYLRDPNRYAQDLTDAARQGKFDKYTATQLQLIEEYIQQRLGPYFPAVQQVGRREALDHMAKQNPDFPAFYGSESYNKILESRPTLREAIQAAESNPQLAEKLPELYNYAYEFGQFQRLLDQSRQQPTAQTQSAQVRQTLQPQTLTPQVAGQRVAKPDISTPEGRKAIIEQAEAKGIRDVQF